MGVLAKEAQMRLAVVPSQPLGLRALDLVQASLLLGPLGVSCRPTAQLSKGPAWPTSLT